MCYLLDSLHHKCTFHLLCESFQWWAFYILNKLFGSTSATESPFVKSITTTFYCFEYVPESLRHKDNSLLLCGIALQLVADISNTSFGVSVKHWHQYSHTKKTVFYETYLGILQAIIFSVVCREGTINWDFTVKAHFLKQPLKIILVA